MLRTLEHWSVTKLLNCCLTSSGVECEHTLVVASDKQGRWKIMCQDVQPGHVEVIGDRFLAGDGQAPAGDGRCRGHVRGCSEPYRVRPAGRRQVTLTQRSSWPCWSLPEAARSVESGGWSVKRQRTSATPDRERGINTWIWIVLPFLQMCSALHRWFSTAPLSDWLQPGQGLWTRADGRAWSFHQTSSSWWEEQIIPQSGCRECHFYFIISITQHPYSCTICCRRTN